MTTKILWLDTETTGTDPTRNGIARRVMEVEPDATQQGSDMYEIVG